MQELPKERIRQTPSPLPPLPQQDALSAEQWGILLAIADTVIPSFTLLEGNRLLQHPLGRDVFEGSCQRLQQCADGALPGKYLAEHATAPVEFKDNFSRIINVHLHDDAQKQLGFILNALK